MVARMKKLWKDQRGVTLIELLAVVVILGIIAAVAAPSIMSNFDDAKANTDKQTTEIIKDAAKRLLMDSEATWSKIDKTTANSSTYAAVSVNSSTVNDTDATDNTVVLLLTDLQNTGFLEGGATYKKQVDGTDLTKVKIVKANDKYTITLEP